MYPNDEMPQPVFWVLFGLTMVAVICLGIMLAEEPKPLPPCAQICVEHVHGS